MSCNVAHMGVDFLAGRPPQRKQRHSVSYFSFAIHDTLYPNNIFSVNPKPSFTSPGSALQKSLFGIKSRPTSPRLYL